MIVDPAARAVIEGRHADPFSYLGRHEENGRAVVRAFVPDAKTLHAVGDNGEAVELPCIDEAGLFAGPVPGSLKQYRLRAEYDAGPYEFEDAYRFLPVLSDFDIYLLSEGTHLRAYEKLGAHPLEHHGVEGTAFVVLAPNAQRVSVVGEFNQWDGRRHQMRVRGNGFWEIFVPGVGQGTKYKFEIVSRDGALQPLKSDPYAFSAEVRPATASIVHDVKTLTPSRLERLNANDRASPISIYEVHLGSWRRNGSQDGPWLTYRELAEQLPAYVADLGFTHIEFLPISEHPFDGSWGYQPTGLYAPTSRFGSPEDFAELVAACHRAGLAVIVDWVPGHFPDDPHGLAKFDGTALYEHADPRQGRHLDWGTLIYNYGRTEVANFLLANSLFWSDRYGIDGLRVDAVASMLYLDYSRPSGGWVPNRHGGRENLEAIEFLRRFNSELYGHFPHAASMAEESTAWPMVSRPVDMGGLGFGYKWNMGWMNDTLRYISKDPIHRRHHHGDINFGLHYAFSENFILPLSHDEVVHGKGSIFGRMPGDRWQRFANLRAYYGFMFGHPGKKLMFMGCEFGQEREWNHDRALDWDLLGDPAHQGVQNVMRDLNRLYASTPALHALDCEAEGFEWLVGDDVNNCVFVWLRKGSEKQERCIVAVNFTPEVRRDYKFRVPSAGTWREALNTDAGIYGGSNVGNGGEVRAVAKGDHAELTLTLPPLGALFLVPTDH
ncbi:1,4-alpha-glucan branching enzyme GlgB [Variibacter gotjawalensis]|uniref:1,4-alpha-glucan branching enzyme GlgB n=1 Tax=Variibacter gotjawalensis TaxID=1333996 RepID=A0A0S3PUM6_9BRAD|nr:1,4-alpha-glucan branching protein GlgB [Variibacter gotjawalensis]NIK49965.1 1,4-alpha-glucan branching enzyme [Variibacter gotjawalensis]RZS45964.1 1,4-alpha-glucan branching enzyme [Variibacter gotjawalensis]BAT59639.1 1,4-alpha-glucan branching enzyme GlgB [Variibacter gotjawalensis]